MEPLVYDLDAMDGYAFERAVGRLFERLGYHVEETKLSGDEGRDVIARRGDQVIVIECKHHRASIGRPVLQKLIGAAVGFPGATHAIVVASGTFTREAEAAAAEFNARIGLRVELWDYPKLVEAGRTCGVFFTSGGKGTGVHFFIPWRSGAEVAAQVRDGHLSRIASNPRDLREHFSVEAHRLDLVPLVLVDYRLRKVFSTSVGVIHIAQEEGRTLVPVAGDLDAPSRTYWAASRTEVLSQSTLGNRPVASYFGKDPGTIASRTAAEVARRHTVTVGYSGNNNQRYSKLCEVAPSDVETSARLVMAGRHDIEASLGPRRFRLVLADDRGRGWGLSAHEGLEDGAEGFMAGGLACNDCARLAPTTGPSAGRRCDDCQRTLCRRHAWRWPALWGRPKPHLCSTCYLRKDPAPDRLDPGSNLLEHPTQAAALGLVPGLPFLLGRRMLAGGVLLAGTAVAALGDLVTGFVLGPVLSVAATTMWTRRLAAHAANRATLATYRPEWVDSQPRGKELPQATSPRQAPPSQVVVARKPFQVVKRT